MASLTQQLNTAFNEDTADKAAEKVSNAFKTTVGENQYTNEFEDLVKATARNIYTTMGTPQDRQNGFYKSFFGGKVLGLSNKERKMIFDNLNTTSKKLLSNVARVGNKLNADREVINKNTRAIKTSLGTTKRFKDDVTRRLDKLEEFKQNAESNFSTIEETLEELYVSGSESSDEDD